MKLPHTQLENQSGLTLIELMVSLVIGLLLAIVASSTYLYSKQAYNAVSENSQLEENGRLAINLLTKNILNAGFQNINPSTAFATPPLDNRMSGCDFGLENPRSPTAVADYACLASTPAGASQSGSINVIYQTDGYNVAGARFQGFDCIGNRAIAVNFTAGTSVTTNTTTQVNQHFFVSTSNVSTPRGTATMGQLSCATDPTGAVGAASAFASQPLIPGIHQIRLTYLTPSTSADSRKSAQTRNTAAQIGTAWSTVAAIEICVLSKSIQPSGNDTQTAMEDCYGNAFTPPASETFRRMTSLVNIRNRDIPNS